MGVVVQAVAPVHSAAFYSRVICWMIVSTSVMIAYLLYKRILYRVFRKRERGLVQIVRINTDFLGFTRANLLNQRDPRSF
jgi:hypothetical protein